MKQEFKKYIDSYIELFPNFNSEEVAFLKSYLTIEEYSKKGFFFECLEPCNYKVRYHYD